MLITTSKENLINAINAVQRAINPKSIIPLYACIKIEVRENTAILTGAGLDIVIECAIPVQMEREGLALVPARYLSDIVRRLPDIPITLEHTDAMEMTIRYEKSIFTIKTMSPDDFPGMEFGGGDLSFTVTADVLKKLIRQSSFAVSADELKGVFTGLLWEIEGKELSLVGTDTHRLAWSKGMVMTGSDETKGSFIIPARISIEIARLIQNGECLIRADRNTVYFFFDNIKILCRVLEGSFPNYRQVIPGRFITSLRADSRMIRDTTERISLFAVSNDASSTIYLEIGEQILSIHSRSDIGYGREEIQIQHEGDDMQIAFNARYITDFFKVADNDSVLMQFSGQLSAGVMKDDEDEDFLYLVLPIKV